MYWYYVVLVEGYIKFPARPLPRSLIAVGIDVALPDRQLKVLVAVDVVDLFFQCTNATVRG